MANFSGPGTLIIKPLQAQLTRDTNLYGSVDPYVVFSLGENEVKSGVCHNGEKTPYWSDTLTLTKNVEGLLFIEVWDDKPFGREKYMACAGIPLSKLSTFNGVSEWFDLQYEDKPAGKIQLNITFQPSMQNYGNVGMGMASNMTTCTGTQQQFPTTQTIQGQQTYPMQQQQGYTGQQAYTEQHQFPIQQQNLNPQQSYGEQQFTTQPLSGQQQFSNQTLPTQQQFSNQQSSTQQPFPNQQRFSTQQEFVNQQFPNQQSSIQPLQGQQQFSNQQLYGQPLQDQKFKNQQFPDQQGPETVVPIKQTPQNLNQPYQGNLNQPYQGQNFNH